MENLKIYCHPKKNFVKSTLVFSLVKTLLSRNFCQKSVTVNFRKFPNCVLWKNKLNKFTFAKKKIREIVKSFLNKNFTFTKFYLKKCISVLTSKCPQYSVNTNFQDFNEIVSYAKKLKFPFHCTTCMYV